MVEDQEIRTVYKTEGGVIGNACRAKSEWLIDCSVAEEVVRQNRRVSVNADDVGSRRAACLRHGR